MLEVRRLPPSRHSQPYVRAFESRTGNLIDTIEVRPLAARPEQFLEFYLEERYRVRSVDGDVVPAPAAVVVGIHSRRGDDLLLSGFIRSFTVQFTPTGFQALFGSPQHLLTDRAVAASDLIAVGEIAVVSERIADAGAFRSKVEVAEAWLTARLAARAPARFDPIVQAAQALVRSGGRMRVDALVGRTGLSAR